MNSAHAIIYTQEMFVDDLAKQREAAKSIRTVRAENGLNNPQVPRSCVDPYLKLYQEKTLDIRVVFGYDNQEAATFDGLEEKALIAHLTTPCEDNYFACGFNEKWFSDGVLTKTITGPDGKPREVLLHVASSSAGFMDLENRVTMTRQQSKKTEQARQLFFDGLAGKSDVVFYVGHSRDGGGPDFAPPRLDKNGHVDYSWYKKERPGISEVLKTLGQSNEDPKIYGSFSCASKEHFFKDLSGLSKDIGLILTTDLVETEDSNKAMVGALNSILGQICEDGFAKNLDSPALHKHGQHHIYQFFGGKR